VARTDRLQRKTGLSVVPILAYVGVVALVAAGLVAWDVSWRRQQEAARKPPPADVVATNLVENIIGRGSVKTIRVDEQAGTVDVTFASATYPPAARATVAGTVSGRGLDRLISGMRVSRGEPLVYVRTADGKEVLAAKAEHTGRLVRLLVKRGDRVEEHNAVALIEPDDKREARQNLETEGLLAWQAITSQLSQIKTVTSRIVYGDVTLATVVGTRGQEKVTATFHESLK
jgi:biotin carboxyl carrier protein